MSGHSACAMTAAGISECRDLLALQLINHLRYDAVQVADEGKVRGADDGGLGVFINGNNDIRALHAGKVLYCAGDAADSDVLRLHLHDGSFRFPA